VKLPLPDILLRRLNGLLFYLLFGTVFGLAAWLSIQYNAQWDWTAGGRNSLSQTSLQLLGRLEGPLSIKAFAADNKLLREPIRELIERYQRHSDQITLSFIDPEREPELTRRLGIRQSGALLLEYQGRSETLERLDEEALSNAIQRLALGGERWIGFLSGHGERDPQGQANHDLGSFAAELTRKGYQIRRINLTEDASLPRNLSLLVIAGPRAALLPGEVALIQQHVEQGGNLLWLLDPEPLQGLEPLAKQLGLELLPGTIVDINAYALGIQDPAMALVTQYPQHPAVRGLDQISLFPHAAALSLQAPEGWSSQPLLQTLDRTWNETGPLEGEIRPDAEAGEHSGPLDLGLTLERQQGEKTQKLALIGDGDFLANAYLGNGGNLGLGLNLIRWLGGDEQLLDIPAKTAPDLSLQLSQIQGALLGLLFLILLPLGLIGTGSMIWWRRRNR
jgi:ABC-type uncharacterized transport system involved in gliding motility auxiliary subunit